MVVTKEIIFVLLIYFCCSSLTYGQEKIPVNVYVYHLKPPFITDLKNERGLYYDFSRFLTKQSSKYRFNTIFIPRKRIDRMIKQNIFDGILLGVNPIWFKDKKEQKYLWTSEVFIDQDEVVSLKENPVEYSGPASLENLRFGGVRGFYYYGINELQSKNKINRIDTISEQALLNMLLIKRVDCTIVSLSTFNYITQQSNNRELFHLSPRPHDKYLRKVLILPKDQEIFAEIEPIIQQMQKIKLWSKILSSYKL